MPIDRNDPEIKALIAEVTEEATSALAAKNKQLQGELRRAKASGSDIDPEEHTRLQTEVEELRERLTKAEKTGKSEVDRLTKELAARESALSNHLIDAGIVETLAKAGVSNPAYIDPLKAMFKTQAGLKSENGQYAALIGDKPLAEAITGYLQSDAGKHFLGAPANAGGGAQGGGGKPNAGSLKRSAMNAVDKANYIAEHGSDAYLALPN